MIHSHESVAACAPLRPAAVTAMPEFVKRPACAELHSPLSPQLQLSWFNRAAVDTSTGMQADAVCHDRGSRAPSTGRSRQHA